MKHLRFLWPAAMTALVVGCGYSGSSDPQRDPGSAGIAATKDPTGFGHATGGGPETTPGGEAGTAGYALPERELRRPGGTATNGANQTSPGAMPTDSNGASGVAGGSNGPNAPAMGTTGTQGDIQGTGGDRY